MGLNQLTIQEAAAGLAAKKFSVTELVEECLGAIKKKNEGLNSYLAVSERALEEARRADAMLRDGHNLPPLLGIPLAVKDNILIQGMRCSAGSKILAEYVAPYDATVIRKLKNQGAIFLGKTNLDEFAMGASTENSAFGPTKNPRDTRRVPGGSSGGSAAAVAADLCLAALGSDTGGSIRQPAAFCGVVGLKPTYGSVSRHGLIAMASSLDQIGPLAKTVEDAATLFEAIAGGDPFDATAVENFEIRNSKFKITEGFIKNLRVGIPREHFEKGLDERVERVIKSAIRKIEQAGARTEEISLPHSAYALAAYYIIVPSEVSANLARYDGIRFGANALTGNQLPATSLYDVYARTRSQGLGAEVKRRIMLGTYALSAGYYNAYYLKAQKVRRMIREDFERAFEKVDLILGPVTPTPAFRLGEKLQDPVKMYLEDIYTVPVNLAGLPALSLPGGEVEEGGGKLPVGIQLIGKWFEEKKLLLAGAALEIILSLKHA